MNRFIFLILLFFVSFICFSQQNKIDSLKIELQQESENFKRLEILRELTSILINSATPKESIPYYMDFSKTAKSLEKIDDEGKGYRYISESYMKMNDSLKAYEFAQKSLSISDKTKELNNYLLAINQLGRAYDYFRNYKEAAKTYLKGIDYVESNNISDKDLKVLSQIYINLGQAYQDLKRENKAIESMLQGVKWSEKINYPTGKAFGLYSIAWRYMDLGNFKKAEEYFLESLQYSDSIELTTYINRNHHGLGLNYSRMGNFEKALFHNRKALEHFQRVGNQIYVFDVLNNIATTYGRMNNPEQAIIYAEKALNVALELNHQLAILGVKQTLANAHLEAKNFDEAEVYVKEILKDTVNQKIIDDQTKSSTILSLSRIFQERKDYLNALKYYKQHKVLNDSINSQLRKSDFANIETKYQTEKKEKELAEQKAATQKQELLTQKANTRNWLLAIGLLAIAVGSFLVWKRYKAEAKAKQIISEQKDVIEELQKELHHRVKNNLSIINAFVDEIKDDLTDGGLINKLTELQNRIASINEVHIQLYKSTDITNVELKKYIQRIADNVAASFDNKNIVVQPSIDENLKLKPDQSSILGLIVNEFLTNSFKYAFEDKGQIQINIKEEGEQYEVLLADNGKGLPTDFDIDNVTSYGLRIMKLLSKQLEGTFDLKNNEGLQLKIQFPKI